MVLRRRGHDVVERRSVPPPSTTDRAHRIGQRRVVTSYKLIAAGTFEERVLAMQNAKRALLANVFEESDTANAALTLADLKALVGV